MTRYPFIVRTPYRQFAYVAEATTHARALEKVLALYPGKFVQLKYSLPMDLISAKVEAAQLSKDGRTIYVYLMPDGEVEVTPTYPKDPKSLLHAYRAGSELKELPPTPDGTPPYEKPSGKKSSSKKEVQNQTQEMETATKTAAKKTAAKKPAKKAAKKVAKKVAAKKEGAATYNLEPGEPVKGTKKEATVKELIKLIEGGSAVYNEKFRPLPLGYLKKMADHTRVIKATIVAPAK